MKKLVSMLLVIVLFASVLSGCATKETGGAGGVTTVRVWTSDGGGKAVWEDLVEEFNKTTGKEKGIKIEWTTYAADYNTVVDVARQNDQMPELLSSSSSFFKEYAAKGDIIPVAEMPGGQEFMDEYNTPGGKGTGMYDGKRYSLYQSSNVPGLIYNKDLFKAAGLVDEAGEAKPPKTLDEIREYAKILTNPSQNVYGYALPLKDYPIDYSLLTLFASSFGSAVKYDYDNLTIDHSAMVTPFNWILQLKKDGSIFPGAESLTNDTARAYFAEGKLGMIPGMSWDVGVYTTQFIANCDWAVAPFPIADGVDPQPVWRDISGSYVISKAALANPEKVMEVYKFIYSLNTRKTMFENSIRIPCKTDAIEAADKSKIHPQLLIFAEMLDEGYEVFSKPPLELEGLNVDEVWGKVWAGELSPEAAEADLNARYSTALKKGVEDGSIDLDSYR